MFQSKNVVGVLIERLTDDVDEVVVEASGALRYVSAGLTEFLTDERNLAIDGGHELCAEMFNKGIMPHITLLTGKVSALHPRTETTADSRSRRLSTPSSTRSPVPR